MIEVGIHGDSDIVRPYTLPPGTPKDRVQLLRKAFDATLKTRISRRCEKVGSMSSRFRSRKSRKTSPAYSNWIQL